MLAIHRGDEAFILGKFSPVKRILHIGGHEGEERHFYSKLPGIEYVCWIEANPDSAAQLIKNVESLPYYNRVINAAASDKEGHATLRLIQNNHNGYLDCSSLLPLAKHLEYYPHIQQVGETVVYTTTVDSLVEDDDIETPINLINIDVQGHELSVFLGANQLLQSPDLKFVYAETANEELYAGGVLAKDLTIFLASYGFFPVKSWHGLEGIWQDTLYEKRQ